VPQVSGCGRAGAWNAAHLLAAESAQADFVIFQPRFQPPQDEAGRNAKVPGISRNRALDPWHSIVDT
jgi:hypothetical protein